MHNYIRLAFFVFITTWNLTTQAQSRCGTVMLQQIHLGSTDYREDEKQFEKWLSKKIIDQKQDVPLGIQRVKQLMTIPVVVHVIHNGEAVGIGTNIPDEQVFSQITILNEDFRRMNADASETPAEFLDVATDVGINFVLAKRDPDGLPTSGIVRVKGAQSDYSLFDDDFLKSQSFWASEDYLNIWVANLSNDLLGYAQFPVSNLTGLTVDRDNNRLTDGAVVDYEYMGKGFNNDPFSQGRTATHEIGHFLGLRHVWGDGGCSADDFCLDTPPMSDKSSGCPNAQNTCDTNDMFQNYMDFSDDVCMNLFTICQASRMQTILSESPRRKSLLASNGGIAPLMVANDLGIQQIISPEVSICTSNVVPVVELRNYGTNTISSFNIDLTIDGDPIQTLASDLSLAPSEVVSISFQSIAVEEGQEMNFVFSIISVNASSDGNAENNVKSIFTQVPFQLGFPIIEDFENGTGTWKARKLTGGVSNWEISNAPLIESDNQAYLLDIFNSTTEDFGNLEMLLSPVLDLSKVSAAELQFKYAYAPVNGNFIDGLAVAVLSECGVSFDPNNDLSGFELYGDNLATTTTKSTPFIPSSSMEWSDATISLNQFLGQQNVQVAIIAQNGGGNNIYVDETELFSNGQFSLDAKVVEFKGLSIISCRDFQAPIVEIKNFGSETITSIDYEFGVSAVNTGRLENINMEPGGTQSLAIAVIELSEGEFEFNFTVTAINDQADDDPKDNTIVERFRITSREDELPLLEQFEQRTLDELNWFPFSITGDHNWTFSSFSNQENNQSIVINAFDLNEVGTQNWLVSPKLNLAELTEASMTFDVSYAKRLNFDDRLQILVSTDCGTNFENIAFDKAGSELAITNSEIAWIPESTNDWMTESVNLSEYAGNAEVLVAFVFTNDNGNNFYLDNFKFFVSGEPNLLDFEEDMVRVFPNPAPAEFNVTFNLLEKEKVNIRIIDMMGHQLLEQEFEGILNQTITFDATILRNGLYLIQLIGENFSSTERVVVMK